VPKAVPRTKRANSRISRERSARQHGFARRPHILARIPGVYRSGQTGTKRATERQQNGEVIAEVTTMCAPKRSPEDPVGEREPGYFSKHASRLATSTASDVLVDFLSDPRVYPDPCNRVEHLETHISHVFLTDRHAYKLKKPVQFEFLDFSTRELRRRACEEEVRLNRRFARDVYLETTPVVRDSRGRMRIGGSGTVVETLVKMRRLPADSSLDSMIRNGRMPPSDIDRLAAFLARHYATASPAVTNAVDYRCAVERHIAANLEDLSELTAKWGDIASATIVRRIHAAQRRWLAMWGDALERRACDGRIVEGHGDLRPEHIYLTAEPVVIDCLEFSRELRQLDVADELAFLAMECERLDAPEIGTRVLDAYRAQSQDDLPEDLLDFYKSYRACVRAKVAALRASQIGQADADRDRILAREYLDLADRHASALGPTLVLVVRGLSGTGKSTLSIALAESLGLELLQTDRLRRLLFGSTSASDYDHGVYSPLNRQRVYDTLFAEAEQRLGDRLSVILDGTFLSARLVESCRDLAAKFGAIVFVIECRCPVRVVHQRMAQRQREGQSYSDADSETHSHQQTGLEAIPGTVAHAVINTTVALPQQVRFVTGRLRELWGDRFRRRRD
jgi:aminoglycoside phosphotransferase family enzyme/predicted kinase